MSDAPTRLAVVGSGFRAEAFLRVAAAAPDRFEAVVVVARRPERARELEARWSVASVADLSELRGPDSLDFVVNAASAGAAVGIIEQLTAAGHAVLTETPVAPDRPGLERLSELVRQGARIQVAEQYHLEPLVSAQLVIAHSGLLGEVGEAFVSVAHDYHGFSVLRRALGAGFRNATVTARRFDESVQLGPSRYSDPEEARLTTGIRTTAWLDFEGGLRGTYDFDDQQYRSFIRTPTLTIRGTRGELRDDVVRYVDADNQPVTSRIERLAAGGAGNHEGLFARAYVFEGRRVWANGFLRARLSDEELGIAGALAGMAAYVAGGGPELYSVAEAAQDVYLQTVLEQSLRSGRPARSSTQSWAV
ncbi:Gfo/Idh/MocA family protein [Gryllotalpicola protaetiae]|uniref:Gfo/Idh/MocA family oxidoreductase n=1 Tax=Gryllotalpicola protaetiae TaxID=2419771 RepID=A0A387BS06_9MICO|nr:Gfo/Idh/MocA family oxidoreductase [Gryllotalpicola protaetiae]AYG03786.1 gfo/Idh/MocA family oxidoreductase [Gryllotalpicola protaetiae]